MSKTNTIVAKRRSDGALIQSLPDGSARVLEDKTDWNRLRAMTDEEVTAAANERSGRTAHDARAPAEWNARRVPRTRTLRRAHALTQEEL